MDKFSKYNYSGHVYFVTTKAFHNRLLKKCCEGLIDDVVYYRRVLGCKVFGYVILPDHLHLLIGWDVEEQKGLIVSEIIQFIKSHSAKEIAYYLKTGRRKPSQSNDYQWVDKENVHTPVTNRIWQPSFYDFNVYLSEKFEQKLNYIHCNLVRVGLAISPKDYQYFSARNYLVGDHSVFTIDRIEL